MHTNIFVLFFSYYKHINTHTHTHMYIYIYIYIYIYTVYIYIYIFFIYIKHLKILCIAITWHLCQSPFNVYLFIFLRLKCGLEELLDSGPELSAAVGRWFMSVFGELFTYLTSVCPWMCSDSVAEPKWQSLSSLGSPCHTRHKISHPATAAWKSTQLSNDTPAALPQAGTLLSLRTLTVNNLSPPCPLWDSGDNGTGRSATACFWLSFNLWSLRGVRRKLSRKQHLSAHIPAFFLFFSRWNNYILARGRYSELLCVSCKTRGMKWNRIYFFSLFILFFCLFKCNVYLIYNILN